MLIEYENAKQNIQQEMTQLKGIVFEALSEALWGYSTDQVEASLKGAVKSNILVGAKVIGSSGLEEHFAVGYTYNLNHQVIYNDLKDKTEKVVDNKRLIEYSFEITHKDTNGNDVVVGLGSLYSSHDIVFDLVKVGFALIIINAMIKTASLWVLFLWAGKKYLSRPLHSLTSATKHISQGNFSEAKVIEAQQVARGTEIEVLADSFNTMTDKIDYAHKELRESNHKLTEINSQLTKTQGRLTGMINVMPSILIGVTVNGVINDWNKKAEDMTGVKAQDAIGNPLHKVYPLFSRHLNLVETAIRTNVAQKKNKIVENFKDGDKYFDVVIYPVVNDSYSGAVLLINDITTQVKLEEVMAHSEKMNSVGALASDVAQKISTPLKNIQSESLLMLKDLDLDKNQDVKSLNLNEYDIKQFLNRIKVQEHLGKINDASQSANEIVNNLLEFTGKVQGVKSLTSLVDVVEDALNVCPMKFKLPNSSSEKEVKVVKNYQEELPHIFCYPQEIERVIIHILKNAVDSLKEVEHEPVITINCLVVKKQISLSISDNGCGMDESTRKRIFEPFYSTKPFGEGDGMGLAVSYGIIVENHFGSLTVESQKGAGTTFTVKLPLAPKKD